MSPFRIAVVSFVMLALIGAGRSVHAQDKDKSDKMAKSDLQVLSRLAQADMAEIAAGKVAAQKATNPDVKKYGQHMVDEHTKMLEEGKKLAQSKGVKPPADTDKKHQAALKKLEGLSGAEFDRAYIQQMVQDHQEVLQLAQKTAKSTKDAELKAHLEKGAPHIQEHLDMAKKISGQLGGSGDAKKK